VPLNTAVHVREDEKRSPHARGLLPFGEAANPDLVLSRIAKRPLRKDKVLCRLESETTTKKTTVCVYSLGGPKAIPTVSTPVRDVE